MRTFDTIPKSIANLQKLRRQVCLVSWTIHKNDTTYSSEKKFEQLFLKNNGTKLVSYISEDRRQIYNLIFQLVV